MNGPAMHDPAVALDALRAAFAQGGTRSAEWRRRQLDGLRALVVDDEAEIFEALQHDFRKPAFESFMTEVSAARNEIDHARRHLKRWMRPQRVWTPLAAQPGSSRIVHEPKGVVLVIGPWNYPFYLLVVPLLGALAAGNCVALKPSELAPATSALLARRVPRYLDPDAVKVFEGDVEVASSLLEQRFDHIFFTGSTAVGRKVMMAAARHLTPVTLELGGKSPCIVAADADLDLAARRIAWGKFINAGQTCIAPDYVLADRQVADRLIEALKRTIRDFYGDAPQHSPDFARIIDDRHFARLKALLDDGRIAIGGGHDAAQRYIEPTVLDHVSPESAVMRDEIFGPILPVLRIDGLDDAIRFVRERPKPLALYLFTNDAAVRERVVAGTSSGGVCINDTVMHLAVPGLPFGGVGDSGMGAYHGRFNFTTFSHARAVLSRSSRGDVAFRYPPYEPGKFRWLRRLA